MVLTINGKKYSLQKGTPYRLIVIDDGDFSVYTASGLETTQTIKTHDEMHANILSSCFLLVCGLQTTIKMNDILESNGLEPVIQNEETLFHLSAYVDINGRKCRFYMVVKDQTILNTYT